MAFCGDPSTKKLFLPHERIQTVIITLAFDYVNGGYEGPVVWIFRSKRHRNTTTTHQIESSKNGNRCTKSVRKFYRLNILMTIIPRPLLQMGQRKSVK